MTQKLHILDELGEAALALPARIEQALAANDRIKYLMTLLQEAARHADVPGAAAPDLSVERIAAGITDAELDGLPAQSLREGEHYRIPRATRVYGQMRDCLDAMLDPLRTAATEGALDVQPLERRSAEVAPADAIAGDLVPADWLARSTRGSPGGPDSMHLLVMDVHRELNHLQARIAPETLDGASVYGVLDEDRRHIRAFMQGLNSTAPLKFDHPGLSTTATRSGEALLLQNDIGTTDAHVLVIRVVGPNLTVTYTDVHAQRADFFSSLFDRAVQWTRAGTRTPGWAAEESSYILLTGQYEAADAADLDRVLSVVGSRIVFLIDWNRARRALGKFVRNRDAVELLRWGAAENLGHRALIQLGGAQLVADTIDRSAPEPPPYGKRLDDILGREVAVEYLQFVLRVTATNLLAGRSERLIRDEMRSELARRFRTFEERLIDIAAEHSLIVGDLASAARASVTHALTAAGGIDAGAFSRMGQQWERDADALVVAAHTAEQQTLAEPFYGRFLSTQDDVADALEDVIFLSTLILSAEAVGTMDGPMRAVAELLVRGSRALVQCIAAAAAVKHNGEDEDTTDFLEAVDEVITIEHEADDLEREFVALLVKEATNFRQQHLLSQIAGKMEASVDAMAHTALALREHLMTARPSSW